MDPFAYLSVLTSIVLALGITRLMTGVGSLLQARGRICLYWVHLLWALNVFLFLVLNWWILYRWHTQTTWTFFLFLFVLLSPIIAFLLTILLFPDPLVDGTGLKQHFYANHRWFFVLAALLAPIDAVDTLLKGLNHFYAQDPLFVVAILIIFVFCIIAASTWREKYHQFFAVFFFLYILVFIGINLRLLL